MRVWCGLLFAMSALAAVALSYAPPLTGRFEREIIGGPGHLRHSRRFFPAWLRGSFMTNFNRKVEQASARVSQTVAETTERLEQESAEFIKYLNDEVVPAVRQHSTKALRVASEKLTQLADYMEQQQRSRRK
jgi:hypothetical protein